MSKLLDRIWTSRWKDYLLPLGILFGSMLNFAFFYVGLAYKVNPVRTYGFIIGQLLFAVVSGLALLAALKHMKLKKSAWAGLLAVLLIFFVNFAAGCARYGLRDVWKDYFIHFVCFALPAFFCGICGACSHSEQRFFSIMERMSFFMLPASIIYMNGVLFYCNPFGYTRYLGIMDYMYFSYAVMPFLLVHIIRFSDGEPLEIPILKKQARRPQLLRGIMITVYWVATIGAGTRGTYVCVAGFCVLLLLSKLIHREPAKRAFLLSCAMALLILFNMFIYAPPGMYAVERMSMFLDGLKQGELITSEGEAEDISEKIDTLVEAEGGQQIVNNDPPSDEPSDEPSDVPAQPDQKDDIASENLQIGNRGTLFKLAWKEFLKEPLLGMGVSGYAIKYEHYPHNAILELLCEGGLLLGAPILLLILLAIIQLLRAGWNNRNIRYFFLILMAYAIRFNISGSIWKSDALMLALGFGITIQSVLYQEKKRQKDEAAQEDHDLGVSVL